MSASQYEFVTVEIKDAIAWVSLSRSPNNQLVPEFMDEILAAHQELTENETVSAVVLYSKIPGYFCNGMDTEYILASDLQGRKESFSLLLQVLMALFQFPKPHLSLIEGHATAGGAFLATMSDYRYMAAGKSRYWFSEAAVRLTFPRMLIEVLQTIVAPKHIRKIALEAKAFLPQEALEIGLVDAVYPAAELTTRAERFMRRLLRNSLKSLVSIKSNMRRTTRENLKTLYNETLDEITPFLDKDIELGLGKLVQKS